jgi:hypothetical protein
MISGLGRIVMAALAAVVVVLGLAACSGAVPKDDVATSISGKLAEQNIQAQSVTCPADLKAEVGASVRCEFLVDGQPVDAVATVSSVDGSTAHFDITTEARPIPKALLERKLTDEVGKQAGVAIESTVCTGDLQPQVGQQVGCTVSAQGESLDLDVIVTAVYGGQVDYSWMPRA